MNYAELRTADPERIATARINDIVAGRFIRKHVEAIFDYARLVCDDVKVYESRTWIESTYQVKITGRVGDITEVYRRIENLANSA